MKLLLTAFSGLVHFFAFAQDINMQNGTFTRSSEVSSDSGGSSIYSNNETYMLIICPPNPVQPIKLEFTTSPSLHKSKINRIPNL